MKLKSHGMILNLFLALGLVFSFSIDASGTHGDGSAITADQVDPTVKADVEAFVTHIVDYYNGIRNQFDPVADRAELIRELTIFARDIRREGDYRHGDFYAIGITDNNVITNHARYPELIGYKVNLDAGTTLANTFKALLNGSTIGDTNCENYGQNRVACAAKVESDFTVDVTNIAGLHHEVDDTALVPPDCTGLTLGTTAQDVFDDPSDANLEAYVKDVIRAVQEDVGNITVDEIGKRSDVDLNNPTSLAVLAEPAKAKELNSKVTTRIQERLFCFGSGDFNHENIYVFVMGADLENSTVLVNGNNFDLNGGNLELEDEELDHSDKTIAALFNRELAGGTSAYANYRWDDPTTDADNIENWFEMNSVPGTSPKRSYIEVADLNGEVANAVAEATSPPLPVELVKSSLSAVTGGPQLFIFGSGTYGTPDMIDDMDDIVDEAADADSGGGCAIAGTSNTSQDTLLNLFLIASVLFSVVFLRRHA